MADTSAKFRMVWDWIEHGSSIDPTATALVFGSRSLSYAELMRAADRMVAVLEKQGITPGDRVGLCLNRSMDMVIGLLGILKAGAAYVPLDPAYPQQRLARMVEDAGVRLTLSHAEYAGLFSSPLVWETIKDELDQVVEPTPPPGGDPEAVAYVIFTSGSTGRPKGIAMPHRSLANLISWQLERRTFRPAARVLQYSSISFDVSFQEISTTLASGGTLYLISNEDRKDPRKLLQVLVAEKIQRLFLPYVALRSLIETALIIQTFPADLKETITAGEQLRVDDQVRTFFTRLGEASLDNQYGPSETHVITAHLLDGETSAWPDLPSIGTAITDCATFVLDEKLAEVPEGEEGELYLAGANLALGYVGREDLTQEVFIPAPASIDDYQILYRTGDLTVLNCDGSLEFRGRKDHQIKILGHRVEPGEINNAAAGLSGIAQCLTHAFRNEDGVTRLVTYFTVNEGVEVSYDRLRNYLETRLPDYMVPAFLVKLEQLPYTPSGKVDLKSLPRPSINNSRYAGSGTGYQTPMEKRLAGIWSDLLGLSDIPRDADFFELGGDSLRAVTLFLRISQTFGKDFNLSVLSYAPTISELAALIEESPEDVSNFRSLTLLQRGSEGVAPLFLVHGGQGNVLVFSELCKMLGPDMPVYAFQWSGWDGFRGDSSITKMAGTYCAELLEFVGVREFHLGGYCIGGLIAIEMIKRLKKAGRSPASPLIVWDSPNLESVHYRKDEPWDSKKTIAAFNRMKDQLDAIRIRTAFRAAPQESSEFEAPAGGAARVRKIPGLLAMLRQIKMARTYWRTIPERMKVVLYLVRNKPLPMDARSGYCLMTMVKAVKHHRSSRYSGDMLYFRSDCVVGRYFGLAGWWDDPFLGYAELCDGNFEAHAIGGGHTDVLSIPEMGAMVRERLKEHTTDDKG